MAKMTVVEQESSVVLRYNQTRIEVKSSDLPLGSTVLSTTPLAVSELRFPLRVSWCHCESVCKGSYEF